MLPSEARHSYTARRLVELCPTNVRVVEGSTVKEPYATLSYCWGPEEQWPWGPRYIAKEHLDFKLKKGLSKDALPKIIREAVMVAESLNICYLWVDVMCILQAEEHKSDWIHESKNMGTIYAEAQLNIAASSSRDKEAGLFNEHSSSQHHLYVGCVQVDSTVHGRPSTLYFWYRNQDDQDTGPDAFRDQVDRGELAKRAWVCQERIASPRTLHFAKTQLFWQCNHTLATEDNLGTKFPSLEDDRPWKSFFHPKLDLRARFYDQDAEKLDIEEFHRLWYSFVIPKHYSSRKLTKQRDKLVAVSGLANKLGSYRPTIRYFAGLWEGLVLEGLLWSAEGPGRPFDKEKGYVAPTWSWASRDGGVEYGEFGAAFAPFECVLVKCQVDNEEEEQFGPVKSATLELKGAFLDGKAKPGETKYGDDTKPTLFFRDGKITGRALLDDDSHRDRHDELDVHAVLLRRDFAKTVFLLITEDPVETGRYVRVGIGSVMSFKYPDSFHDLDESSWVIV